MIEYRLLIEDILNKVNHCSPDMLKTGITYAVSTKFVFGLELMLNLLGLKCEFKFTIGDVHYIIIRGV